MAAASLFLLPIAIALQRKNVRSMSLVLLLKLFVYALVGNTFSLNAYNVSIKLTTATLASASSNSMPVITFCLALLLRMEAVKLRTTPGVAKVAGVALCLAGVLVLAFYAGPPRLRCRRLLLLLLQGDDSEQGDVDQGHVAHGPRQRHMGPMDRHAENRKKQQNMSLRFHCFSNERWLSALLEEYPNKMLVTVTQCVFSTVQCFVVAVVAERDLSKWKLRLDVSLLGIVYTGFVVNGVSYYLQTWCMEMKGPVFLAMSNPLSFVFTIFCSSFFLGEILCWLPAFTASSGLKSREAIKSEEPEEEGNKEYKAAAAAAPFAVEQVIGELRPLQILKITVKTPFFSLLSITLFLFFHEPPPLPGKGRLQGRRCSPG
ncbi:hypothetical protein U9M48_041457 [Paspalum notatum var. saurae]|uniref:WAT1-related protein n=1 Tax=Paspalum notatum var. saurae TaxID=547442 RepID=A0AAQ3UNT1_PASNO